LSYDLLRFILLPSICPLPSTSAGVLVTTLSCRFFLIIIRNTRIQILGSRSSLCSSWVCVPFLFLFSFNDPRTSGVGISVIQRNVFLFWSLKSCNLPLMPCESSLTNSGNIVFINSTYIECLSYKQTLIRIIWEAKCSANLRKMVKQFWISSTTSL